MPQNTPATKRKEITGRNLHNEDRYAWYYSLSIIRVVKSQDEMAGRVRSMGQNRNLYAVFVSKHEKKNDYAEDLDVDQRVILKLKFKELGRK
jgi:hypothetical protein